MTARTPQPKYQIRFNPQHFEPSTSSGGKPAELQEIWQRLPEGWWLCAHVVRDEAGVHVRKAFARRGLRPDGGWQESLAVGTYDVVAVEDAATERTQAPKPAEVSSGSADFDVQGYMDQQYGWAKQSETGGRS